MLLDDFKRIRLFVFDVDGVMTDVSIIVIEDGNHLRRMNIKDGYALQLAARQGYGLLVMSGSDTPAVISRMNKLGITDVRTRVTDKLSLLREFMAQRGFKNDEVLYMGDDLPDLDVVKFVGLGCCPADAVPEIKEAAKYISPFKGGELCVRDVIEKVLKQNGHWYHLTDISSR